MNIETITKRIDLTRNANKAIAIIKRVNNIEKKVRCIDEKAKQYDYDSLEGRELQEKLNLLSARQSLSYIDFIKTINEMIATNDKSIAILCADQWFISNLTLIVSKCASVKNDITYHFVIKAYEMTGNKKLFVGLAKYHKLFLNDVIFQQFSDEYVKNFFDKHSGEILSYIKRYGEDELQKYIEQIEIDRKSYDEIPF